MASFLSGCGFALQDIVADTLCYEMADKIDQNGNEKI
jgi:hypothetical protein